MALSTTMRFVMHALICTIARCLGVGMRRIAGVPVIAGVRVAARSPVIASTARAFVPAKINAATATRFNARIIAERSLCIRASNPRERGEASLYPTKKIDDETDNEDRAESDIHEYLQS